MQLKFSGIVTLGDEYRTSEDDKYNGAIFIGKIDIIDKIDNTDWDEEKVTVGIKDLTENNLYELSGDLDIDLGWGYSEYTPVEPDKLNVGSHNLIKILSRYEYKPIILWIANEPINLFEE